MDYTLKSSMDHLNFHIKLNHFLTRKIVILGKNFDRIEKFLPVFLCFIEGRIFGISVIQELVAQKLEEGLSLSQYIHPQFSVIAQKNTPGFTDQMAVLN